MAMVGGVFFSFLVCCPSRCALLFGCWSISTWSSTENKMFSRLHRCLYLFLHHKSQCFLFLCIVFVLNLKENYICVLNHISAYLYFSSSRWLNIFSCSVIWFCITFSFFHAFLSNLLVCPIFYSYFDGLPELGKTSSFEVDVSFRM